MELKERKNKKDTLRCRCNVPKELMLKLKKIAKEDTRSVNSLVIRILKEYFNKK
jgi:predicted HicB family RNase H-like nuclease